MTVKAGPSSIISSPSDQARAIIAASMDDVSSFVECRFLEICSELNINTAKELWIDVCNLYSEPHRFYHTLNHIKEMLDLSKQYSSKLKNKTAVDLAIIYHDVIYKPMSKSNEEDSAAYFEEHFVSSVNPTLKNIVSNYIIETKKHSASESEDEDLKLFIDFDMHILAVDREKYLVYAAQIRKEYCHVERSDYCSERAKFLQATAQSSSSIYASESYLHEGYDARAKDNLAFECAFLQSGRLAGE